MKKFVGCDIEGSLDMMDDLLVVLSMNTSASRTMRTALWLYRYNDDWAIRVEDDCCSTSELCPFLLMTISALMLHDSYHRVCEESDRI
eukprot:12924342-Prorocentrum_lima.AAC.1